MFIPTWMKNLILRRLSNFEDRIKRLEMLEYEKAQKTISSLSSATVDYEKKYFTIEEIIKKNNKHSNVREIRKVEEREK